MARLPRLHVPGGCYHVVLRGNHREALFNVPDDRRVLADIVAESIGDARARAHAFCWMTNHLHLLVQIAERPLGEPMQRIAMRYSRYRHKGMQTTGHLFERRYWARLIDIDRYFLGVLRYIHRNPAEAGVVSDPSDYPWTSHRAFLGEEHIPWLTTDFGLSLFSSESTRARDAYRRFVLEPVEDDGRSACVAPTEDSRVLGSEDFVKRIHAPSVKPRSEVTLEELVSQVCKRRGVNPETLCSRSSARDLAEVRVQILDEALVRRVATLTDVARFFGRDPSTLSKLLRKHRSKIQ